MQQHTQDRRRYSAAAVALAVLGGSLALGLSSGTIAAHAQNRPSTMTLFRGDLAQDSNIVLGAWGSGSAARSKDHVLIGDSSILLTTEGLYQGGRLEFKNPVDLGDAFKDPDAYLRLRVLFTGAGSTQNNFDPESLQTAKAAASPFDRMRFLLTMGDGSTRELIRPVSVTPTDDPEGYLTIAFPLSALVKKGDQAPSGDAAKVKQIAIFGDRYGTLNIGEIGIVSDETPISISPLDVPPAFIGDSIPFIGAAEGGASTLHYSWDFDSSDGIQEDAVGRSVTHVYRKPGKYTVTLTVTDVDGIKKPATETVELDVSN